MSVIPDYVNLLLKQNIKGVFSKLEIRLFNCSFSFAFQELSGDCLSRAALAYVVKYKHLDLVNLQISFLKTSFWEQLNLQHSPVKAIKDKV